MDQYPFGNFRDNPPWPVCFWSHPAIFNAGVHCPAIPQLCFPVFNPDQMDTPYMPYGVMPVLIHANPFMNNFSFPPPQLRLQNHVDARLHANDLNPPLASDPNEYNLLQTHSYMSDLVGPDVINKQSSTGQLQKRNKVRDRTTSSQQNPVIAQVRNTPCKNTTAAFSEDCVNGFNFQPHQNQEQRQPTHETIETLSEQIREKVNLLGKQSRYKQENASTPKVDVVQTESTVVENAGASVVINTEGSVKEHYQTENQNEDHVVKQEQVDFHPKSNVSSGGNLFILNRDITNTLEIASEINEDSGDFLNQDVNHELKTGAFQQEPTDIQVLNKDHSNQPVQPHQYFITTRNIKPTQTLFHQDKHQRFHNNVKSDKPEIHNGRHQGSQSGRQQQELPHWQHTNNRPAEDKQNTSQCSHQHAGRQQFRKTHPTMNAILLENAQFGENLSRDTYKPILNTDIRFLKNGNRHNKRSERSSSKGRESTHPTRKAHSLDSTVEDRLSGDFYKRASPPRPNTDNRFTKVRSHLNNEFEAASSEQRRTTYPYDGDNCDGRNSENLKFMTSRYYINRHFTSKS